MYWQRQGLCCFILVQHALLGLLEVVIAAAHGLSCSGLHANVSVDKSPPSTTDASTKLIARYASLELIFTFVFAVLELREGAKGRCVGKTLDLHHYI